MLSLFVRLGSCQIPANVASPKALLRFLFLMTVFFCFSHTRALGQAGDCSICPRTATQCTYNNGVTTVTATHCFNGRNNVYYATETSNSTCTPTEPANPLTYFGYPSASGWYSSCHDTSDTCRLTGVCATDCYPNGQAAFSQTASCPQGHQTMGAYDQNGDLLFNVYCFQLLPDAFSTYRGDLYHDCSNTSYGGPYQLP